ncbi:MAG: hypothetical protein GY833_12570 [Aestuariibacter sp.]|nr:hypothetical protein [Aestuariibacter sp.]|tara:strand:+ start:108696 stop:109001 length:306 start_codon:yes stop_codon:yes gene_type:complete
MITFDFYRKPITGLRTKEDVLRALDEALEEVQAAIIAGNVSSSDLSEAITFLKRFYERLERLILGEGKIDYAKLLKMQAEDPVLKQAKRRFERQQKLLNKQ